VAKRRRSSITELAFHGIHTPRRTKAESVTLVSGTFCHLCVGPLSKKPIEKPKIMRLRAAMTMPRRNPILSPSRCR
jgi:hypothetical protein